MNAPKTVNDLFPSEYLRHADLQGKAWQMKIAKVDVRLMRSKFTNEDEWKAVVYFEQAKKGLVLNKTNALALAELAKDEVFDKWVGLVITLVPAVTRGKETIVVKGTR